MHTFYIKCIDKEKPNSAAIVPGVQSCTLLSSYVEIQTDHSTEEVSPKPLHRKKFRKLLIRFSDLTQKSQNALLLSSQIDHDPGNRTLSTFLRKYAQQREYNAKGGPHGVVL